MARLRTLSGKDLLRIFDGFGFRQFSQEAVTSNCAARCHPALTKHLRLFITPRWIAAPFTRSTARRYDLSRSLTCVRSSIRNEAAAASRPISGKVPVNK